MKPSELQELLKVCVPAGLPIMIKGAPGVGKSDIIAEACRELDCDLIIDHPVVSDPTDYKGLPYAQDGKARFLPFGSLQKLIDAASRTVYFMDDLGQAPPSVQAASMQLTLARRINGHVVSPHVTFLAATNRHSDRSGVTGILEAVKSRWASIVELTPDVNDWCKWALNHDMPMDLINFIRFRPNLLHDFTPSNEIKNFPCPRTVAHVGKLMNIGIPSAIEFETFTGAAGEGFAVELIAYLDICRKLPNPDMVLLKPDTADVPDDPATLYAICGALAKRASEQNVERLVIYANRLPEEFSVLLMTDSQNLEPKIANTRPCVQWMCDHSDVMM
jgi:hypothetical protein